MDGLIDQMDALIQERKYLMRKRRQLQVKGYGEFIQTGNTDKIRPVRNIATHISQITSQINTLQQEGEDKTRMHVCRKNCGSGELDVSNHIFKLLQERNK
ncbi:MAG: hypothetical protein ACYDEQ_05450 [Desulfocucumaceae bacterium]